MKVNKYIQIDNFIIKPNTTLHIQEDIDKSYVDRVHEDILTFLKNVNRLKRSEDFFELLNYWRLWLSEELVTLEKKVGGRGTIYYGDIYDDTMVGKKLNRLEASLAGLFTVDANNVKKYLQKNPYITYDAYGISNIIAHYTFEYKEKDINKYIYDRTYVELDGVERYKQQYFEIWMSNAGSRYISTKKIVDEVFEELNSLFLRDKYIEEVIERSGVKLYLTYMEDQYELMYNTVKLVESTLNTVKHYDWGKKILPELEVTIDFITDAANYKFDTSYSKDASTAGVYRDSSGMVYIAKPQENSDYVVTVLLHEAGHKFYYRTMNGRDRDVWEEYYNSLTGQTDISQYIKAREELFFALADEQGTYKSVVRREDANLVKLLDEYGSVENYFDTVFVQLLEKTSLYDTLILVSTDEPSPLFPNAIISLADIKKLVLKKAKKDVDITLQNYGGVDLLTPLAVTSTIVILNSILIDIVQKAKGNKSVNMLPSVYSGENSKELFAELFALNALRRFNVSNYTYKEISPTILSDFRSIAGLKESKNTNKKSIKESITFHDESRGYHSGQTDMTLSIIEDREIKGFIDYSIYKDTIHIEMIEVDEKYRGKGIGKELVLYLAKEYGYENIDWGMMTDEGYKLQQSLDKKFGVDRSKIELKHISKDILKKIAKKDRNLGKWAEDIYKHGSEKAWDTWATLDYTKENYTTMQDIDDILEWVEGSKSNENDIHVEPPYYVFDKVEELKL